MSSVPIFGGCNTVGCKCSCLVKSKTDEDVCVCGCLSNAHKLLGHVLPNNQFIDNPDVTSGVKACSTLKSSSVASEVDKSVAIGSRLSRKECGKSVADLVSEYKAKHGNKGLFTSNSTSQQKTGSTSTSSVGKSTGMESTGTGSVNRKECVDIVKSNHSNRGLLTSTNMQGNKKDISKKRKEIEKETTDLDVDKSHKKKRKVIDYPDWFFEKPAQVLKEPEVLVLPPYYKEMNDPDEVSMRRDATSKLELDRKQDRALEIGAPPHALGTDRDHPGLDRKNGFYLCHPNKEMPEEVTDMISYCWSCLSCTRHSLSFSVLQALLISNTTIISSELIIIKMKSMMMTQRKLHYTKLIIFLLI